MFDLGLGRVDNEPAYGSDLSVINSNSAPAAESQNCFHGFLISELKGDAAGLQLIESCLRLQQKPLTVNNFMSRLMIALKAEGTNCGVGPA